MFRVTCQKLVSLNKISLVIEKTHLFMLIICVITEVTSSNIDLSRVVSMGSNLQLFDGKSLILFLTFLPEKP